MLEAIFLNYTLKSLFLVLILSLPTIAVAAIIGVLVGLFQAVTQIQDQTLSFAIKLGAVILTLVLSARWSSSQLLVFGNDLFGNFMTIAN